ncbi:MAG: MFS transporter [Paracoccaceae bacterium]|nr:MFS transporter [Paracoccaceae bacterium]
MDKPTPLSCAQQGRYAVAALFFANGFLMGSWAVQIPGLLPRFQISESTLGLLILALGLGAVAAMALTGRIIGHFGTRVSLLAFTTAMAFGFGLIMLLGSLWALVPVLVFLGASIGGMDVAMNANAVEVERGLKRAIMSSSHGFWSLGGFLGSAFGGFLLATFGAMVHGLLVSLFVFLVFTFAKSRIYQGQVAAVLAPPITTEGPAKGPHSLGLAAYILGFMCLAAMTPEGAILDWAALYLVKDFDLQVSAAGLGFGFFSGAMALVRFGGDALRNRFGGVRIMRFSAMLAAFALLFAAVSPMASVAILCFGIAGLGLANCVPIIFSAAGNLPGLKAGVGLFAVAMIGYIVEFIGFRVTFLGLSLFCFAMALLANHVKAADFLQT